MNDNNRKQQGKNTAQGKAGAPSATPRSTRPRAKGAPQPAPHYRSARTATTGAKAVGAAGAKTAAAGKKVASATKTAPRQRVAASASTHVGVAPAARRPSTTKVKRASNPRTPLIAAGVVVVLVAAAVLGIGYRFFWRNIDVTVNGTAYSTRINSTADELLQANDYFGVKPGKLMSVGGKVLDEKGGDRCAVQVNGEPVAIADLATFTVPEGADISVKDGGDATEKHEEKTVDIAPTIEMEGSGAIQFVSQWGKNGKKTVWVGEQSGETVDKEVVEEPTNMVVSALNPTPQGDKKYIALTFDDGPSSYSPDILSILKKNGVKATFFNLGTQASATSATVVEDGHEMASHTNSHQNLPKCDRDTLRSEITKAFDSIEEASGVRPQMIRAPYGAFTSAEWARAGDLISCNVLWNIDTLDWQLPGAQAIVDEVLSGAYNGAIALMHDGGGDRSQDIAALDDIIKGLKADGYELVTVAELMELDGRFPEDVINGTVKMHEDAVLPEV